MYRAVIDPNVIVSGLINRHGPPGQVLDLIQAGRVRWIASPTLVAELHDVLHRPKFRRWFPVATASRTVIDLRRTAEMYDPDTSLVVPITRDSTDDYLIRLARFARADCIVSGDPDLTEADLNDIWVLKPTTFLEELRRLD